MKTNQFKSQDGFSIIEVIIVVVVLSVITAFAIMQLGGSKADLQRQRIAREFKVYLERARFDAVKRRAVNAADMSKIVLNNSSSFTATIDFNENGVIDTNESKKVDFSQISTTKILVSDVYNYPVTISFNQRGHITAVDALNNKINPVFTICSRNCSNTSQSNNELSVISISTTGTIAVLKNAQDVTVLPTPVVTSSPPLFNCYMLIGNYNSTQCTNN
ncbi:MAG: prepilin-type N-terminal cleavage/methylation domain-containing protein [Pyrinomonadaceae bacterium]